MSGFEAGMSVLSIETLSLKEPDCPAELQDLDYDFDKDWNPDGEQTLLF